MRNAFVNINGGVSRASGTSLHFDKPTRDCSARSLTQYKTLQSDGSGKERAGVLGLREQDGTARYNLTFPSGSLLLASVPVILGEASGFLHEHIPDGRSISIVAELDACNFTTPRGAAGAIAAASAEQAREALPIEITFDDWPATVEKMEGAPLHFFSAGSVEKMATALLRRQNGGRGVRGSLADARRQVATMSTVDIGAAASAQALFMRCCAYEKLVTAGCIEHDASLSDEQRASEAAHWGTFANRAARTVDVSIRSGRVPENSRESEVELEIKRLHAAASKLGSKSSIVAWHCSIYGKLDDDVVAKLTPEKIEEMHRQLTDEYENHGAKGPSGQTRADDVAAGIAAPQTYNVLRRKRGQAAISLTQLRAANVPIARQQSFGPAALQELRETADHLRRLIDIVTDKEVVVARHAEVLAQISAAEAEEERK